MAIHHIRPGTRIPKGITQCRLLCKGLGQPAPARHGHTLSKDSGVAVNEFRSDSTGLALWGNWRLKGSGWKLRRTSKFVCLPSASRTPRMSPTRSAALSPEAGNQGSWVSAARYGLALRAPLLNQSLDGTISELDKQSQPRASGFLCTLTTLPLSCRLATYEVLGPSRLGLESVSGPGALCTCRRHGVSVYKVPSLCSVLKSSDWSL